MKAVSLELSSYERRKGQYLHLIDKAINQKRYTLAVLLANRCLVNYYSMFLRYVYPSKNYKNRNTYQIALRIVRYFRKSRRRSWFSSQDRQFNMLSASFYISQYLTGKSDSARNQMDRADAEYARNHSIAIAQKLISYLDDRFGLRSKV